MDQYSYNPLVPAASDDPASQRTASRDSLMLTAMFRVQGEDEAVQVRVRNLSAGGLMAELPRTITTGTPVEIDVRGVGWVPGKIAWTAVGRVGVAFDVEIDPKLARKPVGGGTHTPVYAKPLITRR